MTVTESLRVHACAVLNRYTIHCKIVWAFITEEKKISLTLSLTRAHNQLGNKLCGL